jgi:methylmalonyl-CoA epimerase
MLKKILHIGVVVKDFDKGIEKFKSLGLQCKEMTELKELAVKIGFFPMGDTSIEVISLMDPEKAKKSIVGKQNAALNHICFEVDDMESTIQDFENNGARLVEGYPKPGAHGRVAFFYPETTEDVLIEICQR